MKVVSYLQLLVERPHAFKHLCGLVHPKGLVEENETNNEGKQKNSNNSVSGFRKHRVSVTQGRLDGGPYNTEMSKHHEMPPEEKPPGDEYDDSHSPIGSLKWARKPQYEVINKSFINTFPFPKRPAFEV